MRAFAKPVVLETAQPGDVLSLIPYDSDGVKGVEIALSAPYGSVFLHREHLDQLRSALASLTV